MTNLEKLEQIISEDNKDELIPWLLLFASWHDPDGWADKDTIKRYLAENYYGHRFCIGDVIHYKDSNIYGVVTYVDNTFKNYGIIKDNGCPLHYDFDFASVEREWEPTVDTTKTIDVESFLKQVLPVGFRKYNKQD